MKRRMGLMLVTLVGGVLGIVFSVMAQSGGDKTYAEGEGGVSGRFVAPLAIAAEKTGEGAAGETMSVAPAAGLSELYFFSGVSDDGQQGAPDRKEATSIHCTNLDPLDSAQVEVQVYQWNGTDMYTGTANVAPGRSFTFSTQNTTIYFDDLILGSLGTPSIFQGHGRVLSAGKNIVCTAQVLDPFNYPPLFIAQLPLYDEYGYPAGGSRQRTVFYPIVSK